MLETKLKAYLEIFKKSPFKIRLRFFPEDLEHTACAIFHPVLDFVVLYVNEKRHSQNKADNSSSGAGPKYRPSWPHLFEVNGKILYPRS